MKKFINKVLCVACAAAALFCLFPFFDGTAKFWHGAMCVIFACSSIAFSNTLSQDEYRKIS